LLCVDDRPCTFVEALLRRRDVVPVLLRIQQVLGDLPEWYRERTLDTATFVLDAERPLAEEARRLKDWWAGRRLGRPHFCNPSEPRQRLAQRFARLLGLPALSEDQVVWLRHKPSMKAKLARLGFAVARHAVTRSRAELVAFAQRCGWPMVVKPVEGFACIDTHLLAGVEQLAAIDTGREWLAEEYIPDREYECCALIFAGRVLDTYLSCFPAPPLQATDGAINANISARRLPEGFSIDLRAMVQHIVDGMRLDHGYLHLEFFARADGSYRIGEVALRLAGCEIPANHGLAYGFDIFDALIDIHLGFRPRLDYTRERCVGDLLLPAKPGLVLDITPMPELLAMQGVIAGRLKVAPGEVIAPRRASHAAAGFVHVEGDTVAEVEQRMQRVLSRFRLTVAEPATADR
jgi:hypothetical protein